MPTATSTDSTVSPPFVFDQADAALQYLRDNGYAVIDPALSARLAGCAPVDLQALAPTWHDLPPDGHLKDGGQYRRRRHGSHVLDVTTARLHDVPHRAHWQPTTYNALHGGMLRWFEPLSPTVADAAAFQGLITGLGLLFAQALTPTPDRWFIESHPFRIDTTGGIGRPTPEGAHRDGVDFVAVVMVARRGVRGGETRVFDAHGSAGVRFTLSDPWSVLLLDDARVIHESTPIQPASDVAYRDTLVLTYRRGSFQDPPSTENPALHAKISG